MFVRSERPSVVRRPGGDRHLASLDAAAARFRQIDASTLLNPGSVASQLGHEDVEMIFSHRRQVHS